MSSTSSPNKSHLVYGSYLVFQLFSHKEMYREDNEDVQVTKGYAGENPWLRLRPRRRRSESVLAPHPRGDEEAGNIPSRLPNAESTNIDESRPALTTASEFGVEPEMSVAAALSLLVVITGVCHHCPFRLTIFEDTFPLVGGCYRRVLGRLN